MDTGNKCHIFPLDRDGTQLYYTRLEVGQSLAVVVQGAIASTPGCP
ncbi:MAG: hypothetical protein HS120_03085 [Burkholderiales bacterium]|nr:hypothetical protein [Burkholderiales bacterium]